MSIKACAFCDHPDARHRVIDAILGQVQAGEDIAVVLDDYEMDMFKFQRVRREVEQALKDSQNVRAE